MEELLILVRKYELDYGFPFYFPFLRANILQVDDDAVDSLSILQTIPSLLQSVMIVNVEDVDVCELPVSIKPRFVTFDVLDNKAKFAYRAKIEYPFRPGTPDWESFWGQLRNSGVHHNLKSYGEFVGNPILKFVASKDVCTSRKPLTAFDLERLMLPRFNGGL